MTILGDVRMAKKKRSRASVVADLPNSPFKILMAHFDRVCKSVHKLKVMIDLYMEGKFTEASSVAVEISRLEHEADEIKRHLRATIPRMILMPVSKQDILDILSSNERIADSAQDVAQILDMRQTRIPDELCPQFEKFEGHVIDSVMALRKMMEHLETVIESTFARLETKEVIEMGHHVHEHEYKADSVGKALSKAIYGLEGSHSSLAIFHMMRFADVLDKVADNAENAANKVILVVSK
jgi:predicted phosphate transport protein (TIGR00153 family)